MNQQEAKKDTGSGKRHLIREWGHLRGRWKRRKFDLRAESDVGRAVRSSFDTHVVTETGFDAQSAVVSSRYVDSLSIAKSTKVSGGPRRPGGSITRIDVLAENWSTGHQTPNVAFSYFCERVVTKVTSTTPSSTIDVSTATFGSAPGTSSKRTSDSSLLCSYFAPFPQIAPIRFSNNRSLPFVLSAVLLGEGYTRQTSGDTGQRLVTFLWDPSCLHFGPHSPVMRCTRLNGTLLRSFLRIRWLRRLEAAIFLGIASCRRVRGHLKILGERYLDGSSTVRLMKRLKHLIHCYVGEKCLSPSMPDNSSYTQPDVKSVRGRGFPPRKSQFPRDLQLATTGLEDHFCNAFWSRDGLFQLACRVALSSLLSASSLELQQRGVNGGVRQKMASMSNVLVEVSHDRLRKCIAANRMRLDVPLIDYASALDTACTLFSNALPPRFFFDSLNGAVIEPSLQRVSTTFADRWLLANGPRFATLHVRLCLLHVAHCLPGPLSVLFLKSLDAGDYQTPFESMRWFLDLLEASDFLIEAGLASSCSGVALPVEELESILYDGSARLMRIQERDPLNFTCQCWHLATLAACMVLCSGNRAESGAAHRFPSGSAGTAADGAVVLSFTDRGAVHHECRRQLPKFPWLRQQTSRSFRVLLSEEKNQSQSAQWRFAIVSFLEWSQVVGLLLGSKLVDRNIRQIQREHERHSIWLSTCTNTPESPIAAGLGMTSNVALEGFARLLESNPEEQLHWVRLVQALGRFGDLANDRRMRSRNSSECDGFRGSVDAYELDDSWWGSSRVSWWDVCILAPTTSGIFVRSHLEACKAGEGKTNALCQATEPFEWLVDNEIDDRADRKGDAQSPIERSCNFANLLPAFQSRKVRASSAVSTGLEDLPPMPPEFENGLLKLIVRGHLYGVSDPVFEDSVGSLARDAWDFSNGISRRNTLPVLALRCLQQKGLNLAAILERARIPCDVLAVELT